jgi:hypothetical protein
VEENQMGKKGKGEKKPNLIGPVVPFLGPSPYPTRSAQSLETSADTWVLVTCSKMLWIKNKATQVLMVKNLRPSKHYLPQDIMIFGRRSRRAYLRHFDKQICKQRHIARRENMNNHFESLDYSYIYLFYNHKQSLIIFELHCTFGLVEGKRPEWRVNDYKSA